MTIKLKRKVLRKVLRDTYKCKGKWEHYVWSALDWMEYDLYEK